MKHLRHTLLAGALIALAAGFAYAQTIVQSTLSGNETWNVGQGPGGPGGFITSDMVRNSAAISTKSGSGAATSVATGGTLVWVSTAPTTWAITLPTAPPNGTVQRITSDTTLTTMVTVTAGSGDTMAATFSSQTLTANSTVAAWQYYATTKVWYRVQ